MKQVIGLVKKDLYTLKSYRKTLLAFLIIFGAIGFLQKYDSLFIMMMALGFEMCVLATFSYDEFNHTDRYLLTLPVSKKQFVQSKYMLSIVGLFLGMIVGMICSMILMILNHLPINFTEYLIMATGTFFGISILQAIQIPCMYQFGAEKGRIQVFLIIGLLFAISIGIGYLCYHVFNITISMRGLEQWLIQYGTILFIFLTAIFYFISYKISYHVVLKKDF